MQLIFVVNRNQDLFMYIFQLVTILSTFDALLNGLEWMKVLNECNIDPIPIRTLIMYSPVVRGVSPLKPILAILWCPVAQSIVGKNIFEAAKHTPTMVNLVDIQKQYPNFEARLIGLENLNEGLCDNLWPKGELLEMFPSLWGKVLTRCVAKIKAYMSEHIVMIEDTSILIMCGTRFDTVVQKSLKKSFPNRQPQIIIAGHPVGWQDNRFYSRDRTIEAMHTLGCT